AFRIESGGVNTKISALGDSDGNAANITNSDSTIRFGSDSDGNNITVNGKNSDVVVSDTKGYKLNVDGDNLLVTVQNGRVIIKDKTQKVPFEGGPVVPGKERTDYKVLKIFSIEELSDMKEHSSNGVTIQFDSEASRTQLAAAGKAVTHGNTQARH